MGTSRPTSAPSTTALRSRCNRTTRSWSREMPTRVRAIDLLCCDTTRMARSIPILLRDSAEAPESSPAPPRARVLSLVPSASSCNRAEKLSWPGTTEGRRSGSERFDFQFPGELVQARAQGLRDRDAELRALFELRAALLPGQPDARHTRHALRPADLARELVHTALELVHVAEGGDRDRDDRVAGVGGRHIVGVEVDGLASHRCAVQRSREEAEHQGEPVTLVAADRNQQALIGALRIGERPALMID